MTDDSRDVEVIPLLEETIIVHKTQRETGRVRIRLVPEEDNSVVQERLTSIDADIERVSIGRFVDEAPQPHWDGDTLVVPVLEEVLVTEKKLRLVEEVRIRRRVTTQDVSESVTLRRTEAVIERLGPEQLP